MDNDIIIPSFPVTIREDAYLNLANGVSIHNAAVIWYGRAKSGKTRTLIKSFQGESFLFLDFDRNYRSTIEGITLSGGQYLNGDSAFDVLTQLANGNGTNRIVIVDALGSVVSRLTNWFINQDVKNLGANRLADLKNHIGITHEATVAFFNLIIEPMTRNGNSINFIHHTTENNQGSKMEGNKGAWLSVFDFTYHLDTAKKVFLLEADRLPIAPKVIGDNSPRQMLIQEIKEHTELLREKVTGVEIEVAGWNDIYKSKLSIRPLMNLFKGDGSIVMVKIEASRAEYIDVKRTLNNIEPKTTSFFAVTAA